jgi:hypothetical protein
MAIETLGQALSAGWRVRARCVNGREDYTHSARNCVNVQELDLETLVWTRGRDFPLARMESRLKCPRCGNRRIALIFEPPAREWRVSAT